MKRNQFLLLKLMEECAEVSQRASKQIQFGADEIQKGQDKTNKQRLRDELLDLINIAEMLDEVGELVDVALTEDEFQDALKQKRDKLNKYLKMSFELGQLPELQV